MNKRPRFIAAVLRMALANLSHTTGRATQGDDANGMRFTCLAIERAVRQWLDDHPEYAHMPGSLIAAAQGWYIDLMSPPGTERCEAWFEAYYCNRAVVLEGEYDAFDRLQMTTEFDQLAEQVDEHGVRGTQHLRFLMLALAAEVAASERI